jgi:carbon storage regulator CsrA
MRRRAGESFLVGAAIEIEVLEVCGARVKLGIVAPDSVLIQRKETQITRDENITAARSVRQQNISSLLNKVAFQPVNAPVKNLTDAAIIDDEMHLGPRRKNTRTVLAHPRYDSVKG